MAEIAVLLDEHEGEGSLLSDEQWAKVEVALADESEPVSSHEAVFARLAARSDG